MIPRKIKTILALLAGLLLVASPTWAGNKRIMSVRAAKVLAERALIESVYGLKVRCTESVEDMVAASFVGKTESKTAGQIKGIKYDDVCYDPQKDIAQVTASVCLPSITNIDGETIDLKSKTFRRVAFATSTPSMAGPIRALRAAELDAYAQLVKRIVGFTLESHTTVENYLLRSDSVKTKVLATLYMAELMSYGWDQSGDAYVTMTLNLKEISDMIGEGVVDESEIIEVTGEGAQEDDFQIAKKN
jgi:hypothetical protein